MGGEITFIESFDDPRLSEQRWGDLLLRTGADRAFLTRAYLCNWWRHFQRGRLMIAAIEQAGELRGIVPLYADSGMLYLVGSGGSDYLDVIGAVDAGQIAEVLGAAAAQTPEFAGCVFYHLPSSSATTAALHEAAGRLGWDCFEEGGYAVPQMQIAGREEEPRKAAKKESLVRNENGLRRMGDLRITQHRTAAEVLPQLPAFFDQHQRRWNGTETPSQFNDPAQQAYYRHFVEAMSGAGMLRFTRVELDGRPLAFHLGLSFGGRYLYYKPTFEVDIDKRSPGQVMLRHVLLDALEEGARVLDFGLGDEAYKMRFATSVERVTNWGLYPRRK